jgi:hypothetical protein
MVGMSRLRHTPARTLAAAALVGVALLCGAATPAAAQTTQDVSYGFEQVYPAAVRFLRIDQGYAIVEQDVDAGYVLFDIAEDRRTYRGALELVRIRDQEGRAAVRLVLRITDRPGYIERMLLDRLGRKLRAELGEPPPPPRDAPAPAPAPNDRAPAE